MRRTLPYLHRFESGRRSEKGTGELVIRDGLASANRTGCSQIEAYEPAEKRI